MSSVRLVVAAGILIAATACGSNYSSSTPAPSPSPSPAPSPSPSSAPPDGSSTTVTAVTIPIGASILGNRAFAPDDLNVTVGTTVTWMNTDSVAHTSTSNAAGWDSGIVNPGGQFSTTFSTPGTYQYHCAIHPGMVGTVVVR